ncbi:DUF551 domain-containing protein [Pseudomonas sp. G.S.17]|uniref:DUF551 domain-containing protein n=1 Tax=Pseudomonas sp. G.S.17 TaxID=3137451 RepID=UPI00311CC52A
MSEWRRLIDCEPHQGQPVLVFGTITEAAEYWRHEPGVHDGDTGFFDANGDDLIGITHWMPLPQPPTA